MLTYPNIDPVAISLGPLSIRWYGISYLLAFILAFFLCLKRGEKRTSPWNRDQIADLFFYGTIGVIFGGTFGHILFYDPQTLLTDPLALFRFWEPGRSFHGGLMGVLLAMYIYGKKHHRSFLEITDLVAPCVPLGLGLGRLGNFMNAELWGRVTDMPWGMVFPLVGTEPRHPSQLYEFALEGIVLFLILFFYSKKERPLGMISGLFGIYYGLLRFAVEYFREPEVTIGFLGQWFTMGQLLSLPMIIIGFMILVYAKRNAERKEQICNSI